MTTYIFAAIHAICIITHAIYIKRLNKETKKAMRVCDQILDAEMKRVLSRRGVIKLTAVTTIHPGLKS